MRRPCGLIGWRVFVSQCCSSSRQVPLILYKNETMRRFLKTPVIFLLNSMFFRSMQSEFTTPPIPQATNLQRLERNKPITAKRYARNVESSEALFVARIGSRCCIFVFLRHRHFCSQTPLPLFSPTVGIVSRLTRLCRVLLTQGMT